MNTTPDEAPDPGLLRFLKILVFSLAGTMIIGLIVLVGLFVMRFPPAPGTPAGAFPTEIALPAGEKAAALTRGPDWLAVVTESGRLLIFSLDGVRLLQEVRIATQGQ